jgi:hypothetical protein
MFQRLLNLNNRLDLNKRILGEEGRLLLEAFLDWVRLLIKISLQGEMEEDLKYLAL